MNKEKITKVEGVENSIEKAFDKIIGYDAVKKELMKVLDIIKNTEKYEKFGVKMPRGLLLAGKPGLGKTLMAQCFIEGSGRKCFQLRKNQSDGKFMDEIKNVFAEASENQPAIIFLDDVDKFTNGDDLFPDAEEYVAVQTGIDNVKDKNVFVIATANKTSALPSSLLRSGRFDVKLDILPPTINEAKKIIKYHLRNKNYVEDLDVDLIAKILIDCSCADLEHVINQAGIYAGFEGKEKITMKEIIKSCMRVIFNAPEDMGRHSDDVRMKIAYHEAGHAVISELLEPQSVNILSICKYLGDIGGVTSCNQSENYFHFIKYMENRIMCLLGGKAATEIVYGEIDVGANSDLHRIFSITEKIIDDYCGYGFDKFEKRKCSNDLLNRKETAIAQKIEEYYKTVKKMLIDNRKFLDALAEQLFEKETLIYDEIQEIKKAVL